METRSSASNIKRSFSSGNFEGPERCRRTSPRKKDKYNKVHVLGGTTVGRSGTAARVADRAAVIAAIVSSLTSFVYSLLSVYSSCLLVGSRVDRRVTLPVPVANGYPTLGVGISAISGTWGPGTGYPGT